MNETDDLVTRLLAEGENALRQRLSLGMHKLCTDAARHIEDLCRQKAGLEALLVDAQREIADLRSRL